MQQPTLNTYDVTIYLSWLVDLSNCNICVHSMLVKTVRVYIFGSGFLGKFWMGALKLLLVTVSLTCVSMTPIIWYHVRVWSLHFLHLLVSYWILLLCFRCSQLQIASGFDFFDTLLAMCLNISYILCRYVAKPYPRFIRRLPIVYGDQCLIAARGCMSPHWIYQGELGIYQYLLTQPHLNRDHHGPFFINRTRLSKPSR